MNRFKFRIWDTSIKDWSVADRWYLLDLDDGGIYDDLSFSSCGNPPPKRKDLIIQQCTNLKDKNGIELYEGDILEYEDAIGIIEFNNDEGMWKFLYKLVKQDNKYVTINIFNDLYAVDEQSLPAWTFKDCKLLGNILENPELLKERDIK